MPSAIIRAVSWASRGRPPSGPDGGACHRARLSMPPSSPPPSRYHPLPAGCVCAAAGFLAPMPTRLRARAARAPQASTGPPPAAARPAALEASERRATRNIRGLRTKMIWGMMGVRHGAHTDTRAKSEQRPTHTLLTCFVIESPWRIRSHIHAPPPNRVGQTPRRDDKTGTPASPYELHIRIFFGQYM